MSDRNAKHRRTIRGAALVAVPLLVALLVVPAALRLQSAAAADCTTANVLSGSNFEIDVNGNLKVDGADPCIDWLANGTGSDLRSGVLAKADRSTGTSDDSFGRGTAEDNPNPTIVTGSIPPNKSDLKVFGVFTETAAAGKFLQLFWSRVQNPSGTTNMDFELNQKFCDPAGTPTNCANNGSGVTPETPLRTAGDKLITYDLAKGGTVPSISIRTWTGSAWGPATIISGPGGSAIGSVNTSTISAADSDGIGSLDPFTFGEASISFAALFPGAGCGSFGSAYLKSRSSDSFTAELKDFIAPERVHISNCTTLTTEATATVTIGSPISDTATLSGATSNAGGTITFHLYSDDQCANEASTGLSPVPVSGNGDYNSGNYTPTAVGTYYWTANYSGDANNAAASTPCRDANESSVVTKAEPALTTNAAGPVTLGDPISDTAHLTGATSDAGGTFTFHLFGNATCTNEISTGLSPVAVSGNGDYNSGNYTPTAAGTYYWTASYSGDANNTAVSTACGDANESSVVTKKQPSLTTTATANVTIGDPISDTATLSGATADAGGTITFHLYSDDQCANEVTIGLSPVTVSGNGDYNSGSYTPTAVGAYYWTASYSGDANNLPVSTACGDPGESSVVGKAPASITTAQRLFPQDTATVGAGAGGTPTGSVTFKLFGPNDMFCAGSAVYSEKVTLANGSASTSNTSFSVSSASADTYSWLVEYSGDATHDATTSSCNTEHFTATIVNG
jgi:Cu/Zn superoxide dismutase